MGFLDNQILGIHTYVWIYLLLSIISFIGVLIYINRERLKEYYIKWRFPEKVIKIIIHYPSGLYKRYWRLIPETDDFTFDGRNYNFTDESIIKENDFFIRPDQSKLIAIVEGKTYILDDRVKIKDKSMRFPEIHYVYDIPTPINFSHSSNELKFNTKQLADFKDNDLFKKLLTLEGEKSMLVFVIAICILNLLATLFVIAKLMGWIKG